MNSARRSGGAPLSSFEESELERRVMRKDQLPLKLRPIRWEYLTSEISSKVLEEMQENDLPGLDGIASSLKHAISGRIRSIRSQGKMVFMSIFVGQEKSAVIIQLLFRSDNTNDFAFVSLLDAGDVIGVRGDVFKTKAGEPTILVREWVLLAKSLRSWPEKWHGVTDEETQLRRPYLAMGTDIEIYGRMTRRALFIRALRDFLWKYSCIEVETPILSSLASGAHATPFVTHQHATDTDWYLRIAPETYLKQFIVAGFPRVFEFAKCFRNEGIDPSHLPEFTMLEYYFSGWNWRDNCTFTKKLLSFALNLAYPKSDLYRMMTDITIEEISYEELFSRYLSVKIFDHDNGITKLKDISFWRDLAVKHDIEVLNVTSIAQIIDTIYKKKIRPYLIQPTVVYAHPYELKPLAARSIDKPWTVESYQIVCEGWEIVNAYTELTDPLDQADRLKEQQNAREHGDKEAMPLDKNFLTALEFGLPIVSGTGIGIDRVCALAEKVDNLREVIAFPPVRPIV